MAGHSLGELAALVAAGSLAERDGLELVALRGRLMQEAGEAAGDGGMVALLGQGAAEHAPELAAAHGLAIANDNSPQQVVLSGARSALPDAAAAAKELGLRAMELPVTGAFHSPMMASAVPEFEAALAARRGALAACHGALRGHRGAVRRHPRAAGTGADDAGPLARDAAGDARARR